MFGERDFAIDEQIVGEEFQAAARGDGGIEHAHGAGGGVARVDENFSAAFFLLAVHGFEGFARHQDFAADLEAGRELEFFQGGEVYAQRDGANGFHVGRDVFAGASIAASDAARESAVHILQRDAEAVELVLGDVLDVFAAAALAHTAVEIRQGFVGKSVVQAKHGAGVLDGLEAFAGSGAYANGGGIGRYEVRMRGFEFLEAVHQAIVGCVGNFGLVQHVVEIFVMAQLVAQGFDLLPGDFVLGGYRLGHGTLGRTFGGIRIILYRMENSRRGWRAPRTVDAA